MLLDADDVDRFIQEAEGEIVLKENPSFSIGFSLSPKGIQDNFTSGYYSGNKEFVIPKGVAEIGALKVLKYSNKIRLINRPHIEVNMKGPLCDLPPEIYEQILLQMASSDSFTSILPYGVITKIFQYSYKALEARAGTKEEFINWLFG